MMRTPVLTAVTAALAMAVAACGSCSRSAPPPETPPGDLAERGLVIDAPADGASVEGQWVAVSGWFDPAQVQAVLVSGAPVDGFYEGTGHVGVPTVLVVNRKDGRFLAPRVPLSDGDNTLRVVPIGRQGAPFETVTLRVRASETGAVPATLVADPPQAKPGERVKLRASTGSGSPKWQWDFDGDARFDEEAEAPTHLYDAEGRFNVLARTRAGEAWVYAVARLVVSKEPPVVYSAPDVVDPTRLYVFETELKVELDGTSGPTTRYVVAIDGDVVRVYTPELRKVSVLTGLSKPIAVSMDQQQRFYVLDKGNNRIVRFLAADGSADTSFADQGSFRTTGAVAIREAVDASIRERAFWLVLPGSREVSCRFDGPDWKEPCDVKPENVEMFERGNDRRFTKEDPEIQHTYWGANPALLAGGRYFVNGHFTFEELKLPRGLRAVDGTGGPDRTWGDAMVVDEKGVVHHFDEMHWYVGAYPLSYRVHAIAGDRDGRVYVAGTRVLELRGFPLLGREPIP